MNRRQFASSVLAAGAGSVVAVRGVPTGASPTSDSPTLNLSVMLWTILPHEPFEQRVHAVAEAGYRYVELVNEFERWTTQDFDKFQRLFDALSISVDAICVTDPGVAIPSASGQFLRVLQERIATARTLNCRDIIVLSGLQVPGLSRAAQQHASIDTLKRGGDLAAAHGVRLLLESLDPEESPRCFLNSVSQCADIVRAVGNPSVRVLYDFYHEQISGGNLIKKLVDNIDLIGLVHIADVPGRHEPGTGEINYGTILRRLVELNFTGTVAMEFLPAGAPIPTLRAAREYAQGILKPRGIVG